MLIECTGGTHKTNVRAMARDGIVLLKNTDSALPLSKPKSIAVIGSDSIVAPKGANACVDRGCNDGTLVSIIFSHCDCLFEKS